MPSSPHVLIIGAGIGGLCLAHGLRRAGVSVRVYEREPEPGSRWEGYRIHINPVGARSLRACLPDRLWEAFLATSATAGEFGFLTERLAELVVVEESIMYPGRRSDPAEDHYAVDRATLRRLLLAGLEDVVHFGAAFDRYALTDDGRVAAVFADGGEMLGDVLVGADGSASRVRRQYLPHARQRPAGVAGVAHKLWLTEQTRAWVPARLQTGMNQISGAGVSLFTSVYDPPPDARQALERVAGSQPKISFAPYLLCALNTAPTRLPTGLAQLDSDALREVVDELLADWHPTLRRIVAEADPTSRSGVEFTASAPTPPWSPTRVTVLGDAVHTMPATGGLGANTALRDARLLTAKLSEVVHHERPLSDAIGDYEHLMRRYGYAAVDRALAIKDQMLSSGPFAAATGRAWFRLNKTIPTLRRRSFARWSAGNRPEPWE